MPEYGMTADDVREIKAEVEAARVAREAADAHDALREEHEAHGDSPMYAFLLGEHLQHHHDVPAYGDTTLEWRLHQHGEAHLREGAQAEAERLARAVVNTSMTTPEAEEAARAAKVAQVAEMERRSNERALDRQKAQEARRRQFQNPEPFPWDDYVVLDGHLSRILVAIDNHGDSYCMAHNEGAYCCVDPERGIDSDYGDPDDEDDKANPAYPGEGYGVTIARLVATVRALRLELARRPVVAPAEPLNPLVPPRKPRPPLVKYVLRRREDGVLLGSWVHNPDMGQFEWKRPHDWPYEADDVVWEEEPV